MLSGGLENESILKFLLGTSFVIAVIVFFMSKKKIFLAIFIMSALSNLIIYWNTYAFINYYKLEWLAIFAIKYWPFLNLALLITLIIVFWRKKLSKKND